MVEADDGAGADAEKGGGGLLEDLFAMGDEQDAAGVGLDGVEGGEISFAEPGGEDDEAAAEAVAAGLGEGGEGFGLPSWSNKMLSSV